MRDRFWYMMTIANALPAPNSAEEQNAALEACLVTAATIANAMSTNTIGMSAHHIEESATAMIEILDETFGFSVRLAE